MIKKLSAILLLWSFSAQAGSLPPATIKGQSDLGVAPTTFNLQVPGNQITRLGGVNALIETGNESILANPGAEGTSINLAAYADAAGVSPVDMTGGSPNTTCTRTTTAPLAGIASYLMTVNSGATRQGEGCAFQTISIPLGKRGKTLTATFDYITTGTMVSGDFPIYAYQVDGAGPHVLTPLGVPTASILGAQGTGQVTFTPDTDATQIRFGVHVGRSVATTAATITFDSVRIAVGRAVMGLAGGNWKNDSTLTSNISTSGTTFLTRRVGDSMEVLMSIDSIASASGGVASVTLPFPMDTSKLPTTADQSLLGTCTTGNSGIATIFPTAGESGVAFYDGSDALHVYFAYQQNTGFKKVAASTFTSAAGSFSARFTVPIAGYDANVSMNNSSTWKISMYLATGTRVVGVAPANLGEYRSYNRAASGLVYSDAAPNISPTSSDGAVLYGGPGWATADTAGNVSKYDIFVGKNKNTSIQFYLNSGRTGYVTIPELFITGSIGYGVRRYYDPTTGIFTIEKYTGGGQTASNLGYQANYADVTQLYFDITVSENALAVGIDSTTSGGGSSTWGSITGTLSSQTDLQSALGLKHDRLSLTRTVTTSGTLSITDDFVAVNAAGATTQTLNSAATSGQTIVIKNIGAGSATISSTDLIDGATTAVLTPGSSISLISSGGTWNIW